MVRSASGSGSDMAGRSGVWGSLAIALVAMQAAGLSLSAMPADDRAPVTLSIIGTSDLHGSALPRNGVGGLSVLAGYVDNLRRVRAADGGAVLLFDSGDTFQGDVESNLSEGAFIVDAL